MVHLKRNADTKRAKIDYESCDLMRELARSTQKKVSLCLNAKQKLKLTII